ncbi:hypothetical protein VKT23_004719 [Stygiomarasmius scandens]|uniref:DUF1446-domain-containing protein n=1 Tax=Marasmiellus scandens TaxID=2682957 RepID=A0ABR1JXS1_9AGAR
MMSKPDRSRPVRIANCSGAVGDGFHQMYRQATEGPVDAIFGDYLSEMNIGWRALEMNQDSSRGYEAFFLGQLGYNNTASIIAQKNIKLITDAGAFNTYGLYVETKKLFAAKGFPNVKVAWVEGDNVLAEVKTFAQDPGKFPHLDIPGEDLSSVKEEILSANAYIGIRGVVAALEAGAQVIICGRICDATAVMAVSAWWHNWSPTSYNELASSLVAGHIAECGAYATGGNFSSFQSVPNLLDPAFPIIEMHSDGSFIVTVHNPQNCFSGAVTTDTVTAQLVYEIQGPTYLNPDVKAELEGVRLEQIEKNCVKVTGVQGNPPPPTTKLAVQLFGGYQAEMSFYTAGLDIEEKFDLLKRQVFGALDKDKFIKLTLDKYGMAEPNPRSLKSASVQFRLFMQAKTPEPIEEVKKYWLWWTMGTYPGCYINMDLRTLSPKPFTTFFPALISQSSIQTRTYLEDATILVPSIPLSATQPFEGQRSYDPDPQTLRLLSDFGSTRKIPLGSIVLARSGDKGANSNVGLWVRHEDEWGWLRSFLTMDRFKTLLRDDFRPSEYKIDRFELSHLRAVHFVCYGLLEEGTCSSSLIDCLGKGVGEFLRAQVVDIPEKFVGRSEREKSKL